MENSPSMDEGSSRSLGITALFVILGLVLGIGIAWGYVSFVAPKTSEQAPEIESANQVPAPPSKPQTAAEEPQQSTPLTSGAGKEPTGTVETEKRTDAGFISLTVDWLAKPKKVELKSLGLSFGPQEEPGWESDAFQIGVMTSAPFQGKSFYIIERICYGPCPAIHYRVIDDRSGKGLVLLKNLSNPMYEEDEKLFVQANEYEIADLHAPEKLLVDADGKRLLFEEEPFSPATFFDDFLESEINSPQGGLVSKFTVPNLGKLYESQAHGYFALQLPDSTVKLYRLEFPMQGFFDNPEQGYLMETVYVGLKLNDGKEKYTGYTPVTTRPCPPRAYNIHRGIENKVELGGTITQSKTPIYLPKDKKEKFIETWEGNESYADFKTDAPFFFIKDDIGRFVLFMDVTLFPGAETECGWTNSAL